MGRFRPKVLWLAVAILSLSGLGACGGTKRGGPLYPGKINLTPGGSTSLQQGDIIAFTASVQTSAGTNLNTAITYISSDSSILNVAPNGVACAGHWDALYTTCTAGGTGVATVTASALGAFSIPTYVFVHAPIDSITVTGILLDGVPVQEPCLSQGQSMTVEAHAYSQGSDITSSVGPFTWSAQFPSVVNITPLLNIAYSFATNQATVQAAMPGLTQIYASASGATSTSFVQPQFTNSQGTLSPVLDFFETCPIQTVALEVGPAGSQQTGQTTFVTSKGTSETVTAVITDAAGNTSLPNSVGGIVLNKIPLTWTSSAPGAITVGTSCTESCTLSTPSPGSASVTAACSPPTCNIGFPEVPASLSTPALLASCTQFFHGQFPQINSCQQLIPYPVYPQTPVSGLVTGTPGSSSVLATSTGCAQIAPLICDTSAYFVSTSASTAGGQTPLASSPNSLLFDLAGDKAYMGSNFGAQIVNPTNFGSSTSAFTALGSITGNVLAISNNGNVAVFSDTLHTPNQVYVVNTANASSLGITALTIPTAVAAAFSPDGLKVFIFGNGGSSLYVYSSLQALQGPIALSGPASSAAFSSNGAVAFAAESSANGNAPSVTAFNTCNNQIAAAPVTLPANPLFMRVLPAAHIDGRDSNGYDIPDGTHIFVLDSTGVDILTTTTSPALPATICPQVLNFVSDDPLRLAQRVELGQGNLQPVNFFASADNSQLYVLSVGSSTITTYDFNVGSVIGGIELLNNATPVSADITVDSGTIVVAGSDGLLHRVSTALGGSDTIPPVPFPNLPNYLNPFCTAGNCTLTTVLAKP